MLIFIAVYSINNPAELSRQIHNLRFLLRPVLLTLSVKRFYSNLKSVGSLIMREIEFYHSFLGFITYDSLVMNHKNFEVSYEFHSHVCNQDTFKRYESYQMDERDCEPWCISYAAYETQTNHLSYTFFATSRTLSKSLSVELIFLQSVSNSLKSVIISVSNSNRNITRSALPTLPSGHNNFQVL